MQMGRGYMLWTVKDRRCVEFPLTRRVGLIQWLVRRSCPAGSLCSHLAIRMVLGRRQDFSIPSVWHCMVRLCSWPIRTIIESDDLI